MIGKKLGHYEILKPLGAGGMGAVYRARDTKLDRDVAIKVLPPDFANDRDRLARFTREAKSLATLNHPNIAAIYGLEDEGETRFIAMELVEGETLGQRIVTSGRIEIDDALAIARQIALAFEAAHERGIVHRDLKPANVMVTPGGAVKVLDFGLAKANDADGASSNPDLSTSPTATSATLAGVIMGTAAYMSPEQARGKPVDKRTDIFAFGAVVHEMLAGVPAFGGETVTDVLASVVKQDPDWDALPAEIPPRVRTLLRRCLQKDPARRLHDIADARIEIDEVTGDDTGEWRGAGAVTTPAWKRALPWAVAGAAIVALLIVGVMRPTPPATESPGVVTQFEVSLGSGQQLTTGVSVPAVSPAGDAVAFAVREGTHSRIMLRRLDERAAQPVAGTKDGYLPFFSPDGQWLGFSLYGGDMYRIPVAGGERSRVAGGPWWGPSATWLPDGRIISDGRSNDRHLVAVNVDTREVTPFTRLHFEGDDENHRHPELLPDGTVLFAVQHDNRSMLARYFPKRDDWVTLATEGAGPIAFLRTGHVLFQQAGATVVATFDAGGDGTVGPTTRVLDAAHPEHVAVSPNGTAAYIDFAAGTGVSLVRVDRGGEVTPLVARIEDYRWPRLSPDGRRLAVGIGDVRESHLWLVDLSDGRRDRIQDDSFLNSEPVWTPDGTRIAYSSLHPSADIYWQATRGGTSTPLSQEPFDQWPTSFSPDGKLLLFYTGIGASDTSNEIRVAKVDDNGASETVVDDPGIQRGGRFSPDGRWLLYSSDESGETAIYLRRYPELDRKTRVSPGDGVDPAWSPLGDEVFYLDGNRLIAVAFDPTSEPPIGTGTVLFEAPFVFDPSGDQSYDVFPDGRSFVMKFPDLNAPPRLFIMSGFLDQAIR